MSLNVTYENVHKVFDAGEKNEVRALKDVSFTVEPGELFCLLGPSGCGKTTLLRSTAGLETITTGQILYGKKDITQIPPFRRNIGMVFQSFALYPHMTVFENVAYGLRVRKTPDAEVRRRVAEVMELVGLTEELKRNPSPSALSGGQQQRVAIARALVYNPDILLLDEPLANLDAKLRRYMRAEIRRIQKATNITTLFVTHDQEEAMAIGDRLAVFRRGVVEQIGTSDSLYNKPENAFVSNFIGKMNFFNASLIDSDTARVEGTSGTFTAAADKNRLPAGVAAGTRVLVGARPEQMNIRAVNDEKATHADGGSNAGTVRGRVSIIQHLGQFIRYEVSVAESVSAAPFEIDASCLVEGVREGDEVFVSINEGFASLYLPDGGNAE